MSSVDIIVPTHRRRHLLDETFAAFAAQSFSDLRVILVNDCPETPVDDIVQCWADRLDILLLKPATNAGLARARNLALTAATAAVVALCDDDDLWLPNHLAAALECLAQPGIDAVCARAKLVQCLVSDAGRAVLAERDFAFLPDASFLRQWNTMPPSCLVYYRHLHQQLGDFDINLPHYCDWDWGLRLVKSGVGIVLTPQTGVWVVCDVGGDNLSAVPERVRAELLHLCTKHALSELPSANFWTMLDVPAVAARCV